MDISVRGQGQASDDQPYFFLSYAHTPSWGPGGGDPDRWVHLLFQDLCGHIMALTDMPAGFMPGFMDREMRSGMEWPQSLSKNLATCRVFVPLLSQRYFSSEMCGREWYAFNERMLRAKARATGGQETAAIVPALWTRVDLAQLPDSVRKMHVEQATFGDRYTANGLYGLIKLNRLRDEYEEAVLQLAERIVRVAHESPLPVGRPRDYEGTPSAFRPRGVGPRHIHLTVAAPTRDTLPEGRSARPYGDDARDWNPYPEESTRPLALFAEELIRSLDYRVTTSSFDDEYTGEPAGEFTGGLTGETPGPPGSTGSGGSGGHGDGHGDGDGGPSSRPGILLVDRWVLSDGERRRRLREFDTGARPWVNAVVPWNHADEECRSEEGRRLTTELERTIPVILDRGRHAAARTAASGVPSLRAFIEVLPTVVAHTTRLYFKHAESHPPPGPEISRPRLAGPGRPPAPDGTTDHGGEA